MCHPGANSSHESIEFTSGLDPIRPAGTRGTLRIARHAERAALISWQCGEKPRIPSKGDSRAFLRSWMPRTGRTRRSPVAADPKESLPRPGRGRRGCAATTDNRVEVPVATPVFNVRRRPARDRFAADATGRWRRRSLARRPEAMERSAVAHSRRLRVARTGGAPSHRGFMDASRWSGGCRRCDLRDRRDGRTSSCAPSGGNDRRRADHARTRPVVDRRPALRMEAHRSTTAPVAFERALCGVFHDLEPIAPPLNCPANASGLLPERVSARPPNQSPQRRFVSA